MNILATSGPKKLKMKYMNKGRIMHIIYSPNTKTLRQMPQNYLLANKTKNGWICNPDLAADKKLAAIVFKTVALIYTNKHQMSGEYLADIISKRITKDSLSFPSITCITHK